MRVYARGFIYNGKSTDKYGLMLCTFDKGGFEATSAGTKVNISTQKIPNRDKWHYYSSACDEALTFTIQLIKKDKSGMGRVELSEYGRWLQRRDGFKKFEFLGTDFPGVEFYAMATEMNELSVGNVTYGIEVAFTTNAPYGFSKEITKTASLTPQTPYVYISQSEDYGYIHPVMEVAVKADGDLSITNQFENRSTTIKGCKAGEVITLDCNLKTVDSTRRADLENRFNWVWFRFCRSDSNNRNAVTSSLPCDVTFHFQNVKKVGIS